tara:strand:- start:17 stop:268 length:252 start_codon:yes stop_codon:yes gene_type:complete
MVKLHQANQNIKTQIKLQEPGKITSSMVEAQVLVAELPSNLTKSSSEKTSKDNKEKKEREIKISDELIFSINKQLYFFENFIF